MLECLVKRTTSRGDERDGIVLFANGRVSCTLPYRGVGFEARGVKVALARVNLLRREKLLKPARQHRHGHAGFTARGGDGEIHTHPLERLENLGNVLARLREHRQRVHRLILLQRQQVNLQPRVAVDVNSTRSFTPLVFFFFRRSTL